MTVKDPGKIIFWGLIFFSSVMGLDTRNGFRDENWRGKRP